MPLNLRHFVATALLSLTVGVAYAQEPTKPELNSLPPDRPVLDPTPAITPPPAPAPRPEPTTPAPTAPAPANQNGGGFQPARPPQPTAQPAPAARPTPANAGTPVVTDSKPENDLSDPRWFVGGNPIIGFSSIDGSTYLQLGVSALLGYRINDRLAIGPGLTYQYSSYAGRSFTNLGGRIFGQAMITDAFFIHAEHEALRADIPVVLTSPNGYIVEVQRHTLNTSFAGLGYRQRIGGRAMFDFMLLYNFGDGPINRAVYSQPELRFNFLFNLGR